MSGTPDRPPGKSPGKRKVASSKAAGPAPPDLARALAERERQLADLTEQSLGFLEALAEARRHEGERQRLAARVGELERLLADARVRLRHAAARPGGGQAPERALEIVYWGGGEAAAAAGEVPASWVGVPGSEPRDGGLRLVTAREAKTPAQCFNLGMAATDSRFVLFLLAGCELREPEALARQLGEAAPPGAALLQPLLQRGADRTLGCDEQGGPLRLEPRPAPAAVDPQAPLAWPAAEAFVVERRAFEAIGLFDEALVGPLALADYALRARAAGYQVLPLPQAVVEAASAPLPPAGDRDRLLVLASRRPEDLGTALAGSAELWSMPAAEVPGFAATLWARAAAAGPLDPQALLGAVTQGMLSRAVPVEQAVQAVHEQTAALARALGEPAPPPPPDLEQALAALAGMAGRMAARRAAAEEDAARLRQELAASREETERLRQELAASQERGSLLQRELEEIALAVDLVKKPHPEQVRERLLQMKADAERLSHVLAAAGAPDESALLQSLFEVRQRLAETDKVLGERNRWIALLLQEVTRRRLFPRALQDHETDFLQRWKPQP